MVRLREFDENEALDAAMRLFWEKGYEATSLTDLTTRMGIQKPSLYSAFGDKKRLFEAALRRYTQHHAARVRALLQSRDSVKQAFRLLFESVAAPRDDGGTERGCFCINTMVELAPHDPAFEVLTREHQMYLTALFRETIERGVRSGELRSDTDAQSVAETLVVSLIGLTVLMKSRPDRTFVDRSVRVVLGLLA
ncbi:TetR/AcrR family transcriptional regulator [Paenibacillus flagellatus]|uniref:TetR/AcrR family transcriptional regulator n=1 Tax=Paenibacillus flagellatus TaxID=2211139 RepID=A0A2V5KM42_9BACL|nr:TetR/AcrR family transcriptional regulator [Paenibacillus flagellatus]PYI56130.1 TetR/AcrR family transcriptional regulator [Paenibacillus flagellatus]